MKISGNGPVNWDAGKTRGVRQEASQPAGDQFVSGGNDWAPVKPNVAAAVQSNSSGLRSVGSGLMLGLALALTVGATGCASIATAQATHKSPIVQVETPASYQVGKGLHEIGQGVKTASQPALDKGKEVGKEFGQGVAKEAKSFWKGLTGQ